VAAEEIQRHYGQRARELHGEGKKILGYLCALAPVEMIKAAGFIPFRIKGDVREPITKADTYMEKIVCPLVRSCFDLTLKGRYDFLDGLVIPHACDSIARTYEIWRNTLNLPYVHFIDMPHSTDDSSLNFFKLVLNSFRESLSGFTMTPVSDKDLKEAIQIYNKMRGKVRELSALRSSVSVPITGGEYIKVLVATMGLPVEEACDLLDDVIKEVRTKQNESKRGLPRIMVFGAQVDNPDLIELIEDSGSVVVADDLCPGGREFYADADMTNDPLMSLAERYLRRIHCARTYKVKQGSYQEYLEERFGQIGRSIREAKVDGVILYIYRYCDPFGFEVSQIKGYIERIGKPILYLEDDYSMSSLGRLRTRIQAFLELMS
jgi:bcr-type benzoyl-CoA reductase subunit C